MKESRTFIAICAASQRRRNGDFYEETNNHLWRVSHMDSLDMITERYEGNVIKLSLYTASDMIGFS